MTNSKFAHFTVFPEYVTEFFLPFLQDQDKNLIQYEIEYRQLAHVFVNATGEGIEIMRDFISLYRWEDSLTPIDKDGEFIEDPDLLIVAPEME